MKPYRAVDWFSVFLVLVLAIATRAWYLCTFAQCGQSDDVWQAQGESASVRTWAATREAPDERELDRLTEHLRQALRDRGLIGMLEGYKTLAPLAARDEFAAYLAPAYPVFRVLWEEVASYADVPPKQWLRWTFAVLGSLTAVLVFMAARRAFDHLPIALLAGLGAAFYPLWIVNVAELGDGVFATFVFMATLVLGIRAGQQGGAWTCFCYGVLLGLAMLTRGAWVPFVLVAFFWFLWRCRDLPQGWVCSLLTLVALSGTSTPWLVYLYRQTGSVIPGSSSSGWHLWVGNNSRADGGPFREDMVQLLDNVKVLAEKPQTERYYWMYNLVVEEWYRDPPASLARRLRAGVAFFLGHDFLTKGSAGILGNASAQGINADEVGFTGGALAGLLALLLLAPLGWRWSFAFKECSVPLQATLFWIPLPYVLSHAETLHGPRLPLDGVLLILAALALVNMIPGLGARAAENNSRDENNSRERTPSHMLLVPPV